MDTDSSTSAPADPKFQRVFEAFSWSNTQSNLTITCPKSTRIPPGTDPTSAFLDLQRIPEDLDGRHIFEALPEEAVGTKFRADTKFIQIFFDEEQDADNFIAQGSLDVGHFNIPIIPPKGKLPPLALIKLDNVPIRSRKFLTETINEIMSEYCAPVEIAPVTLKGSKLITTRWEMLARAIPDTNLNHSLPSIIEIEGQKVLLSWSGSPPTCLQCLTVGHIRKNCPRRVKPATNVKQPPNPKQKEVPQTGKTYANIVLQGAPEYKEIPEKETEPNTATQSEYQGPTSLRNPPQGTRPTTPEQNNMDMVPEYDPASPFNAENEEENQKKEETNRKRTFSSLEGSPKSTSSRNLIPKLFGSPSNSKKQDI